MSDVDMFPVPIEMLDYIEKAPNNNPELFRLHVYNQLKEHATKSARRLNYLQVIYCYILICCSCLISSLYTVVSL